LKDYFGGVFGAEKSIETNKKKGEGFLRGGRSGKKGEGERKNKRQ